MGEGENRMDARNPGCPAPMSWETLVAYWAGDLPPEEEEPTELHLMECAVCTAELQRVTAVTEAIRRGAAAPRGALRVVQGELAASPVKKAAPVKRWFAGAAGGALLAAAAAAFLLVSRGATDATFRLPAPVRDSVVAELSPESSARDVRLQPEISQGAMPNGARVRRHDGAWLSVRVEGGPPFTVVLRRSDLSAGRYQLELVSTTPDGRETSLGFYRFLIKN